MSRRRSALKSLKRKDTVGIILLGDEKVGKSAIIRRWINNEYGEVYQPTVEDFFMKTVVSLHRRVNTGIVDIAGSRQFPMMDDLYIAKSDVIILAYEVGNEKSIASLKRYYENARNLLQNKNVVYVVIGTKHDLHDSDTNYSNEVGKEFFSDLPTQPKQYLTSAQSGLNVNEMFEYVIQEAMKNSMSPDKRERIEKGLTLGEQEEKKERNCCIVL